MAPITSLLLLLPIFLASLISAQNATSSCGQPHTSPEEAFSACCPSSSPDTGNSTRPHVGTFQILNGRAFSYRCNIFVDLEGVQVDAVGPGPCAEACSQNPACVSAAWDMGRACPCYHYVATSRPGALRIDPVVVQDMPGPPPPPQDCQASVASAVASARGEAETSYRSQLSSAVASAVSSAESAARLSCQALVPPPDASSRCEGVKSEAETSCRTMVSFAVSGAVAGIQDVARTSCASQLSSAVSSAQEAGQTSCQTAVTAAVASAHQAAQTSCQSHASSAVAAAVASAESAAQTAYQSRVSSAVASAVTSASASASTSCESRLIGWSQWGHGWSTYATNCCRT